MPEHRKEEREMSTLEKALTAKSIQNYADHLALVACRRGKTITLRMRYGAKTKIGTFRTWKAALRAVVARMSR
jgi:hypothetical protein